MLAWYLQIAGLCQALNDILDSMSSKGIAIPVWTNISSCRSMVLGKTAFMSPESRINILYSLQLQMCILWFWNHLLEYNRLMQNLGEDACSSNAHQVIIGLNFLYCLSAQTIMETLSMSCRLNYDIKSNDIKSDMTPLMLKWTGIVEVIALLRC